MSETVALRTATHRLPDGRALAYSDTGATHAPDVLVCLPGLLETRHTFAPVLHAAQAHSALRVVSVDHCGRGDSDPLEGDQGYTMARYLEDTTELLQHLRSQGAQRLHVLGTSMGGILGMYLAANRALPVHTLILNDVGLSFYWVSIYGLYDGMKQGLRAQTPDEIAADLHVTLGAMLAVQSPTHFDLPYRRDWKGMRFGHLLDHYSGAIRLVHAADSGVCLTDQVQEIRKQFTYARVLEVPGAKHPAPFNAKVCAFVLADLVAHAPPVPASTTQSALAPETAPAPKPAPAPAPVPEAAPVQHEGHTHPARPTSGMWHWLKRKLKGSDR